MRWRDVWLGAVGTAALFEIGKFLIGLYIGKQGLESTFGAASSLVVVLIWVYYSSQIVLLGAEFTHAQAKRNGHVASTPSEQRPHVRVSGRAILCPGFCSPTGKRFCNDRSHRLRREGSVHFDETNAIRDALRNGRPSPLALPEPNARPGVLAVGPGTAGR